MAGNIKVFINKCIKFVTKFVKNFKLSEVYTFLDNNPHSALYQIGNGILCSEQKRGHDHFHFAIEELYQYY